MTGSNAAAIPFFSLTTSVLLIRGQRRLAAFVLSTGAGLAVLVPVTKALIARARPVGESPITQGRAPRRTAGSAIRASMP